MWYITRQACAHRRGAAVVGTLSPAVQPAGQLAVLHSAQWRLDAHAVATQVQKPPTTTYLSGFEQNISPAHTTSVLCCCATEAACSCSCAASRRCASSASPTRARSCRALASAAAWAWVAAWARSAAVAASLSACMRARSAETAVSCACCAAVRCTSCEVVVERYCWYGIVLLAVVIGTILDVK